MDLSDITNDIYEATPFSYFRKRLVSQQKGQNDAIHFGITSLLLNNIDNYRTMDPTRPFRPSKWLFNSPRSCIQKQKYYQQFLRKLPKVAKYPNLTFFGPFKHWQIILKTINSNQSFDSLSVPSLGSIVPQ